MRCLIIDNYDSFTWNIADYVAQTFGVFPWVVRNDKYTWQELKDSKEFCAIIVSPGPGSVVNKSDFHVSRQALEQNEIPVLGICLGFQGLVHIYGGRILHAPEPFHGRRSFIEHTNEGLFEGIPERFEAVRYHSLIVCQQSLPSVLQVTARTDCGLLMGLKHKHYPKWGVQFHPESILTEYGKCIIANFAKLAKFHTTSQQHDLVQSYTPGVIEEQIKAASQTRRMYCRKLDCKKNAEDVFLALFGDAKHCFWLDSQSTDDLMARYSMMGAVEEFNVLKFKIKTNNEEELHTAGKRFLKLLEEPLQSIEVEDVKDIDGIPSFAFRGGYVGYMTYETKAIFGASTPHTNTNHIPDALWMRVDHFVAFDHLTNAIWLMALEEGGETALVWLDVTEKRIHAINCTASPLVSLGKKSLTIDLNHSYPDYLEAIARCKQYIANGESYEICLTELFSFQCKLDPLMLYRYMRRGNPAPFGAFLRSGDDCILSTSPERFLQVDGSGVIQAKPIKGTCRRDGDPEVDRNNAMQLALSEKEQAENLMIVDLMRNDLSRVAVPGSVTVSKLMDIESYKTVHQMVSTVEANLRKECCLIDLLKAVFPGGSITGAPKLRSMQLIDEIERSARGVYCGSIGYLGFNCVADLNIAIRSLSYDGQTVCFGAGGAVTFLSDPQAEFDEVLLKTEAILKPIWQYLSSPDSPLDYKLYDKKLSLRVNSVSMNCQVSRY